MSDFPHLKLPYKISGISRGHGGGKSGQQTIKNKENRQQHGEYLKKSSGDVHTAWQNSIRERKEAGVVIPNENDIPVFLRIDTKDRNFIDSLVLWGIDVISEEENGYIIGATVDNFKLFEEKLSQFIKDAGRNKDTAAKIWELVTDEQWRVNELLKGELSQSWDSIDDAEILIVQLGVACFVPNRKTYPDVRKFDTEEAYQTKVQEFRDYERTILEQRDEKQIVRENEIEEYIKFYGGEIYSIWDNETDALFFKVSVCGKGLKDIVFNYQYLFEVQLDNQFSTTSDSEGLEIDLTLNVLAPPRNAPSVCIIDSGIQESHRLLKPAIDSEKSKSYVEGDDSTADYVKHSGHGTKVAGAVLYPKSIPKEGDIQLHAFINNARILDSENSISHNRFEPVLIEQIVKDFPDVKIFNLSVNVDTAFRGTHMPSLAASIDKAIHQQDILFVVSVGNLYYTSSRADSLGITNFYQAGLNYPEYLTDEISKIANPGMSFFAISVGSIASVDFETEDYKSIAGNNNISPFSRIGLGLWGSIKPDVVEFGGDYIINKGSSEIVTADETSPELVYSTLHGAKSTGKDTVGTSFSAPKVSSLLAKLISAHPDEKSQMYRALVIQSARLPDRCFENPSTTDFQHFGYGIPDENRALFNYANRITFIQSGSVEPKKADLYNLVVPPELRGEGKEFRILVEITLAFTSKTRLTRKRSHSYLANWLDWRSSKYNEGFTSFRNRTIEQMDVDDGEQNEVEDANSIKWVLRENPMYADNDINRNNSTVQKSWVIIEPHTFADEFSVAVVGHCGWDKSLHAKIPYSICVSFEALGAEIELYNLIAEAQVEVEQEQEIEL
jgi:Subtilase family